VYASTLEAPILIIGAAHVVDLEAPLRATLRDRALDGVALELDAERAQTVLNPQPETRGGRSDVPLFARLWGVIQRRLGAEFGEGGPGAEMRVGAEVAKERGLPIFLIDDPIRDTLSHLLRSLSVRERVSLLVGSMVGLILPPKVVERQLDAYAEAPEDTLGAMRDSYPGLVRVLIDERNEHMAERLTVLRNQGYGRLAVIVGDAHIPGLTDALHRRGVSVEPIRFGELRLTTGP
jgi:pheromone shutdown protein TraB